MIIKGIMSMLKDDDFWTYIAISILFCLFVFFADL